MLSARERRNLLLLGALYAAVVIPIGIHKGGDFAQELKQSERLLHGLPLYAAPPEKGVWWPPFTALGLVPFALLARWSLGVAKGCWALLNVCCLGWSLARARSWTSGWLPVAFALAAVANPLESNFEHLNAAPLLLALIVAAAADLEDGRATRAGRWVGLATAIKAFPALLLVYLAYRRRWRGAAAGGTLALALTVGGMLPYGPVGAVLAVRDWAGLTLQTKLLLNLGSQSVPGFGNLLHWPTGAVVALELACLAGVVLFLERGRRDGEDALTEVGVVLLLAVLFSPTSWLHYYLLAFPAWLAALRRPTPHPAWSRALLGAAGVLTSGVLTFGLYPSWLGFIRAENYAWGGLVLLAALVAGRLVQPQQVP